MENPEPRAAELTDSVIRVGARAGYRIERDTSGRLQFTAVNDEPVKHSLTFALTDQELRAYYLRLAANTGKPGGASTPWQTWILLMSVHLEEAVYEAGILDRACIITVGETGFRPVPDPMGSTPFRPRPLTDLETIVMTTMLSAGRDGFAEYRAQIPYSEVVSTWSARSPSVEIKVRPGPASAGGVTDGIVASGAVTDSAGKPIGEVILWAEAGRLSGIEYAWYTGKRPTQLPEPDRINLL